METRTKDLTGQAKTLAQDAKESLQEKAQEVSAKARTMGTAAMESARGAYQASKEKVISGAEATDEAIRENPYTAIGIAFGVGLLIGIVARRK
ncbi:MAG: hypothetical protein JWM68_2327 [Verrucomicrobiales bacterium]|nr:hypothetical protein [Verrucomicrobiales bacterium]